MTSECLSQARSTRPEISAPSPFRRVWGAPIALAVVTIFGLLSALLGQHGIWWVLSWFALAAPLLAIAICLRRARRRNPPSETWR